MAQKKKADPAKAAKSGKQIIVSVQLDAKAKQQLDTSCDERGMTIKSLLGRLIEWFGKCDKTDQAVVLGQLESSDAAKLQSAIRGKTKPA